jgi:hypothetical protein
MITASHPVLGRRRAVAPLAIIALALLLPICACSASGRTSASAAPAAASATCQQVSAVLSDGPDPGTDPVGYAEAQILPLRQIHTADPTLSKAIGTLAGAYSGYFSSNGTGKTARAALTTAINRINSLCPGAGATP